MKLAAIIPAAGSGERLGHALPKALVQVGQHSILYHAVAGAISHVDQVIVAAPAGSEHIFEHSIKEFVPAVKVVTGGEIRSASVASALKHIDKEITHVLVHDAARAFTPASVYLEVIHALSQGKDAVIPALPMVDTIKRVKDQLVLSTEERAALVRVQTPQGFKRDLLERAHEKSSSDPNADDAFLVEQLGERVHVVMGHEDAFKITVPNDLVLANLVVNRGRS